MADGGRRGKAGRERGFVGPEKERIDVFEGVAPSVVNVDTFITGKDAFSTDV